MENHYVVLGVSESATPEVIKIAYEGKVKALARSKAGPQRKAEGAQLFRAYKTLSDPRKRAAYDAAQAGALEDTERRSRTGKRMVIAVVLVAFLGGLGWYFAGRGQRLGAVKRQEAELARDAAAAKARAAAEARERRHRGVDDAMGEARAAKKGAEEAQRIARERRKHEVEAIQAQAAAERKAAEERNARR